MSVSTSLGTGASGVNVFQSALAVVGNNIANTDTTAFKENDISFAELVSKGIGRGRFQIGQGALVNNVQNRFTQGALDRTRTDPLDLAIEGEGFFILKDPLGSTIPLFTRAGEFDQNEKGLVVDPNGFLLQGSLIDPVTKKAGGDVAPIDLSARTSPPQATTKANFTINLFSGDPDTTTVVNGTGPTHFDPINGGDAALIINGFSIGDVAGNDAGKRITALIEAINDATDVTGVTASNATPTSIRLTHIAGGEINIELNLDADPDIAAKTGLQDGIFLAEGSRHLTGLVTTKKNGSKTVDGMGTRFTNELIAGDAIVIANQRYTVESIQSDTALTLTTEVASKVAPVNAVGQAASLSTPIAFFDSLGTERLINVRFRKTAANEWEWNAVVDQKDNLNGAFDQVQATGRLSFTAGGVLDPLKKIETGFPTEGFDFKGLAPLKATDPKADPSPNQKITFDFAGATQYAVRSGSVVLNQTQDGFSAGLLGPVSVDSEGILNGLFSNGKIQPLYQLAIALFPNQDGLTRVGGNLYTQSDVSGEQIQAAAGSGGRGKITSKALEVSTVDLAVQFVKLITYQRGFQANSRVITTSDEVVQELVNLKR